MSQLLEAQQEHSSFAELARPGLAIRSPERRSGRWLSTRAETMRRRARRRYETDDEATGKRRISTPISS